MEVVVASDLLIDYFVAGVAGASSFSSPIQRCDVPAWPSTASGGYSCREKGGGRCGGGVGGGQRDALCQKSFELQIDTHCDSFASFFVVSASFVVVTVHSRWRYPAQRIRVGLVLRPSR